MRLIYQGVELGILNINECVGEAVYDDTLTDYLYTRYSISVSAVVNGQAEVRRWTPPTSYERQDDSLVLDRYDDDIEHAPPGAAPDIANRPTGTSVAPQPFGVKSPGRGSYPGIVPPVVGFVPGTIRTVTRPGSELTSPPSSLGGLYRIVRTPNAAPLTDAAIRHRLQTPRGRLYIFSGTGDEDDGNLLLRSPAEDDDVCDARNGPIPRLYGIQAAMGEDGTFMVEFQIETYICETEENRGLGSALLSNRFSMKHSVSDEFFLDIMVEGVAHFRTDKLYEAPSGLSPDDFRLSLVPPVPFGMVRGNIIVEGLPDGTGIRYSFMDRQVKSNFVMGAFARAAKVSVSHKQALVNPKSGRQRVGDQYNAAIASMQAMGSLPGAITGANPYTNILNSLGIKGLNFGTFFKLGVGGRLYAENKMRAQIGAMGVLESSFPYVVDEVEAIVIGDPSSSRTQLYRLARSAAIGAITLRGFRGFSVPQFSMELEYNHADRTVICRVGFTRSLITGAAVFKTLAIRDNNGIIRRGVNTLDVINGPTDNLFGRPFPNPALPGLPAGTAPPPSEFDGRPILSLADSVVNPDPALPLGAGGIVPSPNPRPIGDFRSRGSIYSLIFSALSVPGSSILQEFKAPAEGDPGIPGWGDVLTGG